MADEASRKSTETPSWATPVLDRISSHYPPGPYRIAEIIDREVAGRFTVNVVDRETVDIISFEFIDWVDEISSLRDGEDSAVEAFSLLLHAHLDERWSELGR